MTSDAFPAKFAMRLVDGSMYMKVSGDDSAPDGWMQVDMAQVMGGGSVGGATTPDKALDQLSQVAGEVTRTGTGEVRGIECQIYEAKINMGKAMDRAGTTGNLTSEQQDRLRALEVPMSMCVDSDGLMRLMEMHMDIGTVIGSGKADMEIKMEFYDFGADVDVVAPEDFTVLDPEQLTGAGA